MEKETSGFENEILKNSRKYRGEEEEDKYYTESFHSTCPVDSSKVVHTVRFIKATCTRVDDIVDDFHCSRNGSCVKCTENYW